MAIRPILGSEGLRLRPWAQCALDWLENTVDNDTSEEQAMTYFQKITKTFNNASGCLYELHQGLGWKGNLTEDEARQLLCDHEFQILELEHIDIEDSSPELADYSIGVLQTTIDESSHGIITRHLPGVDYDDCNPERVQFSQFVEFFHNRRQIQFIFPLQNLKRIHSVGQTFRDILEGQWDADAFQRQLNNLRQLYGFSPNWLDGLLRRQLWRLQDLRDGGGFGFTVKLFFLALKQLLSKSSSKTPYLGTFRAITSDWSKYKHSLGTQKLLLDMVMPDGLVIVSNYPDYIVDEFLKLLGNILKGQTRQNIHQQISVDLTSHRETISASASDYPWCESISAVCKCYMAI